MATAEIFEHLVVVEFANWAAAPSCGAIFADHGATVFKVEPPSGDGMRGLMHQAAQDSSGKDGTAPKIDHPFQFSNRGKRSVTLDLTTETDRSTATKLLAKADVVLMNLLPQRRDKLGLSVNDIRNVNKTAIIGLLTGYGEDGPEHEVPGFDPTAFFARTGLSASIHGKDGAPPRWRAAQGDHVTGLSLYAGLVTALLKRERTGEGSVVEASLIRAGAWTNAFDLTRSAADRRPTRPRDRHEVPTPTTEAFRCSDGRWVQLTMPEPVRGFAVMCDMFDRNELFDDERFKTPVDRFKNMEPLMDIFDDEFARVTSSWVIEAIGARGSVCALVMTTDEVVQDPQTIAAGVLRTIDHPDGEFQVVDAPFSVHDGAPATQKRLRAFGEPGADNTFLSEFLG